MKKLMQKNKWKAGNKQSFDTRQMEKPSSSAKFKGFAEFKTERSVLQTGMWKKKSRMRGRKLMLLSYSLKPLECMNYILLIFWTQLKFSFFLTLLQAMLPALVRHQNINPLWYMFLQNSPKLRDYFSLVTS